MIFFLFLMVGLWELFYEKLYCENEYYFKVKWFKLVIMFFVDFKKFKVDV